MTPAWISTMTTMPTKHSYRRGDVVLVGLPNSDLVTYKTRPALIVQATNLSTGIAQTIVAMITSNRGRANHASRVEILLASPEGKQSGLLEDSVVMTDNLATVLEIGSLPMTDIDSALKHTLGLT